MKTILIAAVMACLSASAQIPANHPVKDLPSLTPELKKPFRLVDFYEPLSLPQPAPPPKPASKLEFKFKPMKNTLVIKDAPLIFSAKPEPKVLAPEPKPVPPEMRLSSSAWHGLLDRCTAPEKELYYQGRITPTEYRECLEDARKVIIAEHGQPLPIRPMPSKPTRYFPSHEAMLLGQILDEVEDHNRGHGR